jgi:hypothetical protein
LQLNTCSDKLKLLKLQRNLVVGGGVVIVLATGPKVHGFKPGQERLIFKGDNNP